MQQGERSNSAQTPPSLRHTLEVLRCTQGSHPWVIAFLSLVDLHALLSHTAGMQTTARTDGGAPRSGEKRLGENAVYTPWLPWWDGGMVPPPPSYLPVSLLGFPLPYVTDSSLSDSFG